MSGVRRLSRHLSLVLVVVTTACEARVREAVSPAPVVPNESRPQLETAKGYASYYARAFDGKTTASGTIFDNGAMLAAHPVYSFGTVVKVTNLGNQQSVDVTIVDRGPSPAARENGVIIDLSRAAAERLGFIEDGRAHVQVDVLSWGG
jgi:rare lipoprotein A